MTLLAPHRADAPAVPAASGGVRVVSSAAELRRLLERARAAGARVGLVPTMGALHAGHRTLLERAARECDVVALTIFVNPLQFDDPADLDAYPATLEADLALGGAAGATYAYVPSVAEMYPGHPAPVATTVTVAGLGEILEGASRPGHFAGVATVVAKLFAIAGPCRAYFGEKDYQQLAVVRRMAGDLSFGVEVVPCPTVREPDGLAMSSRNRRLSAPGRRGATVLARGLEAGRRAVEEGERRPEAVRARVAEVVAGEPAVTVDYIAVVEAGTLEVPATLHGETRILIAGFVDGVRLIDNIGADAVAVPRDEENGHRCAGA